jgi:hypothetical protein
MLASEIGLVLSAVVGFFGLLRGIVINKSSASTFVCVLKLLLYVHNVSNFQIFYEYFVCSCCLFICKFGYGVCCFFFANGFV